MGLSVLDGSGAAPKTGSETKLQASSFARSMMATRRMNSAARGELEEPSKPGTRTMARVGCVV